jgi:GT2 family glycosyltransferase
VKDDGETPSVSVVVLTYEPEPDHLASCLDSVLSSDYPRIELLVVDNGSAGRVAEQLASQRSRTRFVQIGRNSGFSAGINRGVREASGGLILLLNPDAEVEHGAITALVEASGRRPDALGFAPKMVFRHDPDLIDAIGIGIDTGGAAFNRGIGQVDIGQYDIEEPVMGCCFGAALLRREAFEERRVGPLDERYFLFYEDVDWCLRATLRGEDFWTVPAARVRHIHSATTRSRRYGFKYRLVQRNLLYTAFKNFEKRRALKVLVRRSMVHARNVLRGRFPRESLQVLVEGWLGVLRYREARKLQRKRRIRSDLYAVRLTFGELPYFDPVGYAPVYQLDTVNAMLTRLYAVSGEERWGRSAAYLSVAMHTPLKFRPMEVQRRLTAIAGPLPEPLLRFFERLAEKSATARPGQAAAASGGAKREEKVGSA